MSDFIKINNVTIPAPDNCNWRIADLSSEESGRSTRDGTANKDVIAQKRTLRMTWSILTWQEAARITRFFKNKGVFIQVTYPDVMEYRYITKTFYTGDAECDYSFVSDKEQYVRNLTCSCIEV